MQTQGNLIISARWAETCPKMPAYLRSLAGVAGVINVLSVRHVLAALFLGLTVPCYAQQQPNVAAQREAMQKLAFLVGTWSGPASVIGPGKPLKLEQTEHVQLKMDGLVMLVEGTGRNSGGQIAFRALATMAYDDMTATYRFRAYNEGRYLDAKLSVIPNGFVWGYTDGPLKVTNTMRLNKNGEWAETTETTVGSSPPRKSFAMNLRRQP